MGGIIPSLGELQTHISTIYAYKKIMRKKWCLSGKQQKNDVQKAILVENNVPEHSKLNLAKGVPERLWLWNIQQFFFLCVCDFTKLENERFFAQN